MLTSIHSRIRSYIVASSIIAFAGTSLAMNHCPPEDTTVGNSDEIVQHKCGNSPQPIIKNIDQKIGIHAQPAIDVVFVLDTTGSMGGLIEGAKQKIWAIANQISQTQHTPIVRMGLVAYRDRGDEYVTRITPLTDDIDTVYADLMQFKAMGGGDTPESVNDALFAAIERFEWTPQDDALKLVYLVGDAPPKMEYKDDVKYQATCRLAYEQGININTIQCGGMAATKPIWQEIAQLANGAYASIEQNGGVVAISSPYDADIAKLDQEYAQTMIDYGDAEVREYQFAKRSRGSEVSLGASPEAAADRAIYNQTSAGRFNLFGKQELVDDISTGSIAIHEVKKEQLPTELQELSEDELKWEIDRRTEVRTQLTEQIKALAAKRVQYLQEHQPKSRMDGFDQKVLEALIEQGARVGIEFKSAESGSNPELKEQDEE